MLARTCGQRQVEAETLGSMAILACYNGDYRKARALHEKCLQFRRESGYRQDIAESLGNLACLLSASEALRNHFGFRRFPFCQSLCDRLAAALQNEMEKEALRAARAHGAEMTLACAVDCALGACVR